MSHMPARDEGARVVDLRTGRVIRPGRDVDGDQDVTVRPSPPAGEGAGGRRGQDVDGAQGDGGALVGDVLPALRRAAERPVLPDWLADRRVAVQRIRWVTRAGARVAARYVVWSPVIAARCLPPVARGTARGARAWYRWVTAARLAGEAAEMRQDRTLWQAAVVRVQRARRARAWVTVAAGGSAAGTVALAGAAWGSGVWWATAAGLAAVAGLPRRGAHPRSAGHRPGPAGHPGHARRAATRHDRRGDASATAGRDGHPLPGTPVGLGCAGHDRAGRGSHR